ncbi:MAG: hypothetical protein ACREM2_10800 [Vulcanimicrobiaceae bacterium]
MAPAACAALAFAFVPPATAQPLATLRVRAFTLAVDRSDLAVGERFHLIIATSVAQELPGLDAVVLPNLAGFETLGDERRCNAGPHRTLCLERLTLDASAPGDYTLGPAELDAIDARNGKPSRFETNTVVVHVRGLSPLAKAGRFIGDVFWAALHAFFVVAIVGCIVFTAVWLVARRLFGVPAARPAAPPPAQLPAAVADDDARLAALVGALEREPSRLRAIAVREELRRRLGARERETLADLVARHASNGRVATLEALRAIEVAAFCEDERVVRSVREALPFLRA